MTLVDSSVWIDLFADRVTIQVATLKSLILEGRTVMVGDLIVLEILQGARSDAHAASLAAQLDRFDFLRISGKRVAIEGAAHYRHLRARGITIRKTIDTLIATRCILDGIPLLYSDRDFDPFVEHLGLTSALDPTGAS